jgi:hypothetical protein
MRAETYKGFGFGSFFLLLKDALNPHTFGRIPSTWVSRIFVIKPKRVQYNTAYMLYNMHAILFMVFGITAAVGKIYNIVYVRVSSFNMHLICFYLIYL